MVALAVAASMLPAAVHAEWKPNIELFYDYSFETERAAADAGHQQAIRRRTGPDPVTPG